MKQIVETQHVLFFLSLVIITLQGAILFIAIRSAQISRKIRDAQARINELTDQRLTMLEQPCR
jgi:hypothetical protein